MATQTRLEMDCPDWQNVISFYPKYCMNVFLGNKAPKLLTSNFQVSFLLYSYNTNRTWSGFSFVINKQSNKLSEFQGMYVLATPPKFPQLKFLEATWRKKIFLTNI